MIILLGTSTPLCHLSLLRDNEHIDSEWEAGRDLARGLLGYIESELHRHGNSFADITGIGMFVGPGSFTGLRIGATVMNTLADALSVPIVGTAGDDWLSLAATRLERGENDKVVLPVYGSGAHITLPRK